jgi:hypothetical protein
MKKFCHSSYFFSILVFAGCKSNEEKKVLHKKKKRTKRTFFKQIFNTILNWSLGVKKEWMLHLLFLPTLAKGN